MKVLFDSDALFALFVATDKNHKKAKIIFKKLLKENAKFYVSNLVIQETSTVLSNKVSQSVAKDFYQKVIQMPFSLISLDYQIEQLSWSFFLEQNKKRTSYIDCSNVVIRREYDLDKIFSFDGFYSTVDPTSVIE